MATDMDSLCQPKLFHLLNDESVEFEHRLKLCRLMWISNHDYPNKFQLLLNWICSQIASKKDPSFPKKSYRESLGDFLTSKCLAEEMKRLPRRINFNHCFIQAMVEETRTATKIEDLMYLQKIAQTLIFVDGMTSPLDTRFEIFSQFISAWIGSTQQIITGSCQADETPLAHEDGKVSSAMLEFTESLLCHAQKNYLQKCIKTEAILTFCQYMFRPMVKFCCALSADTRLVKRDGAIQSLLEQVKKTISCSLFSSTDTSIYQHLDVDENRVGMRKKRFRRERKDPDCFGAIMGSLLGVEGEISASHVRLFYQMFLESYQKHVGLKIGMLQELTKRITTQGDCQADALGHSCPNLVVMSELLHLVQQYQLYQPMVDPENSEKLLLWLKELTVSIFSIAEPTSSWFKCVETLSQVENSIIEPHLQDLLLSLSTNDIWASTTLSAQAKGLMELITNNHVKVRRLEKLMKTSMQAFDEIVTKPSKVDQTIGFSMCIETLGGCFGSEFVKGVSPGLIIGVLSTIVDWLSEKVTFMQSVEMDSESEATVITLFLASKLLRKIMDCTPILTVWKNVMVRKKLEHCLESLMLLCAPLHDLACTYDFNIKLDLSQQMRDLCMQAYLMTLTTSFTIKHTLQRYVVTEFKSIAQGLSSILYGVSLSEVLQTPLVVDVSYHNLESGDSKILYVILMLHNIAALSSDISALDIYNQVNVPVGTESSTSLQMLQQHLQECAAKLDSALTYIRMDSFAKPVLNELEFELFGLIADYFPCVGQSECVLIWVSDVIFLILSLREVNARLENKMAQILAYARAVPNCKLGLKLLESVHVKFVHSMTLLGHLDEGICNAAMEDLAPFIKKMMKKSLKPLQSCDTASVLDTIGGVAKLLQHLDPKCFPEEMHAKSVVVLFSCITMCARILRHSSHGVVFRANSYLEICVRHFLPFTVDETELMRRFDAEMSLPFFGEMMRWVGSRTQHFIKTFLFETIHQSYGQKPKKSFRLLVKRYQASDETNMPSLLMMSIHMLALVEALLISDANTTMTISIGRGRKRSLRTAVQVCKKLKLDPSAQVEDSQEMMRSHLSRLLTIACSTHVDKRGEKAEFYDFLFACFESFAALKMLNSDFTNENASIFLKSGVAEVFEKLPREMDLNTIESMLRCVLCCVEADMHLKFCGDSHLEVLVQLLRKLSDVPEKIHSLDLCISGVLRRLPEKNFELFLGGILRKLRSSSREDAEDYLHFSHTVVTNVVSEYGLDHQGMRPFCRQFVKSLIDVHLELIERVDARSERGVACVLREKRLLLLAVKNLAEILKLTWVQLRKPQVSWMLCRLHRVPLSMLVDHIDSKKEALDFLALFESYCKVVHGVLTHFDSVSHIVPIINAALWHVLQSALKLAQRNAVGNTTLMNSSSHQPTEYAATDELLKCVRLIEKLFQLIAENHKQAFGKAISYVVANFVCALSSSACVPLVRKALVGTVYFLLSIMDQYCVAMVRNALPVGVRDIFQSMYVNYCKYFKYTGRV